MTGEAKSWEKGHWKCLLLAFPVSALIVASGCLSLGLGERNTHIHENPDTTERLHALEQRVQWLEQTLAVPPDVNSVPISTSP
jgi:hypothetical protein